MQLLNHKQVIMPEHTWDKENIAHLKWDYTQEVTGAFDVDDMLEKTCPLSLHKAGHLKIV